MNIETKAKWIKIQTKELWAELGFNANWVINIKFNKKSHIEWWKCYKERYKIWQTLQSFLL